MASTLVDNVRVFTLTTGRGALTLGDAVPGCRGVEALVDGNTYSYSIVDGSTGAFYEIGSGVYTASSGQLTRTVETSSSGSSGLVLSGSANVAIVARAADLATTDLENVTPETFLAKAVVAGLGKVTLEPQQAPFNVVADGTDCSAGFQAFLNAVCGADGTGSAEIPDGDYAFSVGMNTPLLRSVSFKVSAGAKFSTLEGFASGQKLFEFTGSNATDLVFSWEGGDFDGQQIPLPQAGQANDIFSLEGTNAVSTATIILDRVYTGDNWLAAGGDSHVFVGGVQNVTVHINDSRGSTDSAVYLSGNSDGSVGQNAKITGNFTGCIDAVSVKRQFYNTEIEANVTDCQNGVGAAGFDPLEGGYDLTVTVNALRTERACHMIACDSAILNVVSKNIGVSIAGYTSTTASALLNEGASNCSGMVVANGINPACTRTVGFTAVSSSALAFTPSALICQNNQLQVNATGMGQDLLESGSCQGNFYSLRTTGALANSAVSTKSMTMLFDANAYQLQIKIGSAVLATFNATQVVLGEAGETVGFFGGAGSSKPTVTGSKGGNAAVASLLTGLAAMGLVTNSST